MNNSSPVTPVNPALILAIKEEVDRSLSEKTEDDRLFIRTQLQRLATVAKYVGIAIVAFIAVLGIKTAGDLHSVAEKLVISTIEKKDPADIYRRAIDNLYAKLLLAAGLSGQRLPSIVDNSDPSIKDTAGLTDSEYNHILTVLLREDDEMRISFQQGVQLLTQAPEPIWQKSAAALGATLNPDGKNWIARYPDRAAVIFDAFIAKKYKAAISNSRSLIVAENISPDIRRAVIKLALTVGDKDSARNVEKAFDQTRDDSIREEAVQYLVQVNPASKILSQALRGYLERQDDLLRDDAAMRSLRYFCFLKKEGTPEELEAVFRKLMVTLLEKGEISATI